MALRALIVDDQPTFIEAARRLLGREGIDVVGAASTSVQAVQQAERLHPDVVLIDIQLGEESGFDVARRLAAATDGAPTSMILISTHAAADFADLVAVSPVLGFLSKSDLSGGAIRDSSTTGPTAMGADTRRSSTPLRMSSSPEPRRSCARASRPTTSSSS